MPHTLRLHSHWEATCQPAAPPPPPPAPRSPHPVTSAPQVAAIAKGFPGTAAGVVKFSAPLAHQITAGADFMMVPSRFEPCGLIQLHAMQYGTVPLVSSTGGLVDTVKEGVTGFHMGEMDPDRLVPADAEAIAATMSRAAQVFATPAYPQIVKACINQVRPGAAASAAGSG